MHHTTRVAIGAALALTVACSSDDVVNPQPEGTGTLVVKLTDAPFPFDEVERVDVFVVRVDAKAATTTEAEADEGTDDGSANSNGWTTVSDAGGLIDLMTLRNGVTANLGQEALVAGEWKSFRLIIDPAQSSVTLKDGTVLDGGSTPGITFPSAGRSGIKVMLDEPVAIVEGETTEVLIDFDIEQSFVLKGNTLLQNGLLFKPVIRASVTEETEAP
ncbi:MAG TPA: DUF4382 domain-containing protein [Gemmatimonadaceae bacterium]|nr:DUF4382 domain-containing protein [Gemmatimonadaceae bacterium]